MIHQIKVMLERIGLVLSAAGFEARENMVMKKNLSVEGTAEFQDEVTLEDDLTVEGDAAFEGAFVVPIFENEAAATAEKAVLFYDSTANKLKFRTATAWETITSAE